MLSKSVAFHTLGCKLNFSETSSISRLVSEKGFVKKNFDEAADIYVINTCSVTENADKECRKIVRQLMKRNAQAHVVIMGCYAQLKPKEISEIPGVSLVIGAKEKFRLHEFLDALAQEKNNQPAVIHACEIADVNIFESSFSFGERTRAFLKVQDGCDYSCTYCTIPLARGASRSDSVSHVVEQVNHLSVLGVKEIVLTGINLGDFGLIDSKRESDFYKLIETLDQVRGIERFRISSIEPNLLSKQIIEFVAQSKLFMPHFHVPLQSGSNKILAAMKRRYRRELFAQKISEIKSAMPHACIGADVITGFPDETEKDFNDTYSFLSQLPLSYLHVFTYSERLNTEAATLPHAVSKTVRQQRTKQLRILSEKMQMAFYQQHASELRRVLFESENANGTMDGFTDNYIKVRTTFNSSLINNTATVKLSDFMVDHFYISADEIQESPTLAATEYVS